MTSPSASCAGGTSWVRSRSSPDTLVPAAVYDGAASHFEAEEFAHLIWQIAAINAWNRIAIATRQTVGDYQP